MVTTVILHLSMRKRIVEVNESLPFLHPMESMTLTRRLPNSKRNFVSNFRFFSLVTVNDIKIANTRSVFNKNAIEVNTNTCIYKLIFNLLLPSQKKNWKFVDNYIRVCCAFVFTSIGTVTCISFSSFNVTFLN